MAAPVLDRKTNQPVSMNRVTKGGRKLTYVLDVIQQPERARACGSGAKSSADRRPVDPPPVVELRIFEGEGPTREDITFSYPANFFLFVTLEVARPIAQGRGHQQTPSPQVPVLTGMPVSGTSYLDRPKEAGYFIFPDLSVRHEGKYRLSFNLYEQTKEAEDLDAEPSNEQKQANSECPDASFDWRMEIKSNTFQVYSAKKFPGLSESTMLSRTVAEQGCRVRIRRDVRMRRRDGKTTEEYNEPAEEEFAARGRPHPEEAYRERSRSRSSSAGSDEGRPPYAGPHGQQYPPYGQPGAPRGHLDFVGPPTSQYQPPAPPSYSQPPPAAPQSYQSGPSAPPAPPVYHPPTQPQYRAPAPPTNYSYDRQYPQSAYPSNPPREHREPEYEQRRASAPQPSHVQQAPFPAVDSNYSRPPYPPYPHRPETPGPVNLAPLKMPLEPRYDSAPSPLPSVSRAGTSIYDRPQERSGSYSHYPAAQPAPELTRNGNKRSFRSVFGSSASAESQPLHNGMRPTDARPQFDEDDDDDFVPDMTMSYKRADGNFQSREPPMLV